MSIKIIAFDADDTLWVNEPYFQDTEKKFCVLMEDFLPQHELSQELLKIEIANLSIYGYGIKGYILSMIEAALKISDNNLSIDAINSILGFGKDLLNQPIVLLDNVKEVLQALKGHYRLVVATKGDLLDQERKLKKSGLVHYFHHIEIMSEKGESDYRKLLRHLDIHPAEFLMIGNSIKSDILPVINIGGHAIHVPYHTTWAHENVAVKPEHENFNQVAYLSEVLSLLLEKS